MKTITIGEHTIFPPPRGSYVLDIGCRFFTFAKAVREYECDVVAVEPDKSVSQPKDSHIYLISTAVVSRANAGTNQVMVQWSYGEGDHLATIPGDKPKNHRRQRTSCHSILDICDMVEVYKWEVIKMDCEGAEYQILLDWPGPITNQITVEFHEHTGANTQGDKIYEKILNHINQWYEPIKFEKGFIGKCRTPNYWDALFVLKGYRG